MGAWMQPLMTSMGQVYGEDYGVFTFPGTENWFGTVSYTHLDVYKRQAFPQRQLYQDAPLHSLLIFEESVRHAALLPRDGVLLLLL